MHTGSATQAHWQAQAANGDDDYLNLKQPCAQVLRLVLVSPPAEYYSEARRRWNQW